MGKWAVLAMAVLLGCSASLSAQGSSLRRDFFRFSQPRPSDILSGGLFSTMHRAYYPSLTLSGARLFSLSDAYDWVEPVPDFLPPLDSEQLPRVAGKARRTSGDNVVQVQPKLLDCVGGEVGVFYGHSVGSKFSREIEAGYFFGEMGNDKTQISVGGFYEESNGRVPRLSR